MTYKNKVTIHNGHTENDELIYYNEISPIRAPWANQQKKVLFPIFEISLVGKYIYNVYIVTSWELCFP